MEITLQPFFIFYASRLKEVIRINVRGAPPGEPMLVVLHHESKAAAFTSGPSSRFKERMLQVSWVRRDAPEEQNINFVLPLCAYGNEALRLAFKWPNGEEVVTKPIMITSSEQILQALAKYNFSYRMLSLEEKFSMLNELQQVEWKLGRAFDVLEVGSLDTYFSSDLEKLLAWLTDRMQLIASSAELSYLWNRGYLIACDDDKIRVEMEGWFSSWTHSLSAEGTADPASAERLVALTSMAPKTFALRVKMSGNSPLAFTMCYDNVRNVRHRLEVVNNVLNTLAKADLQCIYNIRMKQVDMLQNVLIDAEYRDVCPSAEGYYEEFDGNSWASVSFATFNALNARARELEEMVKIRDAEIASQAKQIEFLHGEIERIRLLDQRAGIPITNRLPPNGGAIQIHLPAPNMTHIPLSHPSSDMIGMVEDTLGKPDLDNTFMEARLGEFGDSHF